MKWKYKNISITYEKLMIYGFLSILGIVFLSSFHADHTFSETENRTLRTFPSLQFETILNQQFQAQFTEYKNDQFVGRDHWMKLKTNMDLMMGKKELNHVYIGANDQLFEDFQPTIEVSSLADELLMFSQTNKNLHISFMLAPNPISIWQDQLPSSAPIYDQIPYITQLQELLKDSSIHWIDIVSLFQEHKEEPLYYKSDHHWTTAGAYLAFTAFAQDQHISAIEEDWIPSLISDSFYGTLAAKSGYAPQKPDEIYAYLPADSSLQYIVQYVYEQEKKTSVYQSDALQTYDQYQVFFGGNHPLIQIDTTSSIDKNLLVLKDSYANSFLPFLLPYYNKIVVVDPRYYMDDLQQLISDQQITDVLFLYNANTLFQDTSLSFVLN